MVAPMMLPMTHPNFLKWYYDTTAYAQQRRFCHCQNMLMILNYWITLLWNRCYQLQLLNWWLRRSGGRALTWQQPCFSSEYIQSFFKKLWCYNIITHAQKKGGSIADEEQDDVVGQSLFKGNTEYMGTVGSKFKKKIVGGATKMEHPLGIQLAGKQWQHWGTKKDLKRLLYACEGFVAFAWFPPIVCKLLCIYTNYLSSVQYSGFPDLDRITITHY